MVEDVPETLFQGSKRHELFGLSEAFGLRLTVPSRLNGLW
jgi:hypothetical protein